MSVKYFLRGLGWAVVFLLLGPVCHTFWISFSPDSFLTPPVGVWSTRWYRDFASDQRWTAATVRSIAIAILAAVGSLLVATPAAVGIYRVVGIHRRLLTLALLLPALVPPAALGTGLLPLLHALHLWGSFTSMVLVHVTLALPIVFLIVRMDLTDELWELESAARGLGATPWDLTVRVTLPLLARAFLAAGISVFVLSLNESLVSLFLATPNNETLPTVVWPQLRYSASPLVAVASCVTTMIGIAGAVLVTRIIGSRMIRISDLT